MERFFIHFVDVGFWFIAQVGLIFNQDVMVIVDLHAICDSYDLDVTYSLKILKVL
jgi:hypothetical protein